MISPDEIKKKAARKYADFLRATLNGSEFFPLELPVGSTPKSYPELHRAVTALIDRSKEKIGFGYTLVLEEKNTQKYGPQSLPTRILIENATEYLLLLGKQDEFEHFSADAALIRSTIPKLQQWVWQYPLKVVVHHTDWSDLLKACQYFQHNPQPNLYIRELPIEVHTKFVEAHKDILRSLLEVILPSEKLGSVESSSHTFEQRFSLRYREPLFSLRILDPALQQKYGFPISDFSLSVSNFARLKLGSPHCIVSENAMPFLTLPSLTNSIAIFGSGNAVNLLKTVSWLKECSIFYWGDLDVEGFEILSRVRSHFPQTQSILMDAATYQAFENFAVSNEKAISEPPNALTDEETSMYSQLSTAKQRLEQERISQTYVNQYLSTKIF